MRYQQDIQQVVKPPKTATSKIGTQFKERFKTLLFHHFVHCITYFCPGEASADKLVAHITLQRVNYKYGEVVGNECTQRGANLAAAHKDRRRNGNHQLHTERKETSAKHTDRPTAGNKT